MIIDENSCIPSTIVQILDPNIASLYFSKSLSDKRQVYGYYFHDQNILDNFGLTYQKVEPLIRKYK